MAKSYIGRIKNSGAQVVRGPYAGGGRGGKSSVKSGGDLRSEKN